MNVLFLLLFAASPRIETIVHSSKAYPDGRSELTTRSYHYGRDSTGARGLLDPRGHLYAGPDSFIVRLSAALRRIEEGGPAGHALITYLDSDARITEVVWGPVNEADIYHGDYVHWDDADTLGPPSLGGRFVRPAFVGLAHELAHIMDVWRGTVNLRVWKTLPGDEGPQGAWVDVPFAELYATHIENKVRSENGIPLRVSYAKALMGIEGDHAYPDRSSLLLRPGTRESLYFDCKGHTAYRVLRRTEAPEVY